MTEVILPSYLHSSGSCEHKEADADQPYFYVFLEKSCNLFITKYRHIFCLWEFWSRTKNLAFHILIKVCNKY